jgi:ABC-type glycerol-3-phosphate transport system permease component
MQLPTTHVDRGSTLRIWWNAGVTLTVIPILIFLMAVQRAFVRGRSGAIKG